MAKKDFRLLLACENQKLQARIIQSLKATYSIAGARNSNDFFSKLRQKDYSLAIVDHHFGGQMEVEDLHHKIVRFCPNVVFVVYSEAEQKSISKKIQKYRAIDYILYSSKLIDFVEKIHKAVRWTILQSEVTGLGIKITQVAESIKTLSKKIEKVY